jgi:hypothetical protein
MILEAGPELIVCNFADERWKGLVRELALDVEDVSELVKKQFLRILDLRHLGSPLLLLSERAYPLSSATKQTCLFDWSDGEGIVSR